MEKDMGLLWEVSWSEFLFVTIILAGGAAFLTGRAVALTWRSNVTLALYMVILAAATRFIHFALFHGTLLSPWYYVVDLVFIAALAFIGKRLTRTRQMVRQYGFEYRPSNAFAWSRKD